MSKDMDERFEIGEILADFENDHDEVKAVKNIFEEIKKELADQKARAIEIARDNPCKMSGRIPHNHTATCNRAIATALEEKL